MTTENSRQMKKSSWWPSAKALVPAEWSTWRQVLSSMLQCRAPRPEEHRRNQLWSVYQFALGAIPGALCSDAVREFSEGAIAAIFGGILAFSGVLAGFLVTLMLFTGRLGTTQALTLESVRSYGSRLRYLLVSQAATLMYMMAVAVLAVLYLFVSFADAPLIVHSVLLALLAGGLASGVVRSVLLPIQIFELHDAYLDDELAAKAQEVDARFKQQRASQRVGDAG